MRLSDRAQRLSPSATMAIDATAKKMLRAGVDVVGLGVGEPDFDTPEHVKEAARQALAAGFTKYTPASGIPELREAICTKLAKENHVTYDPSQTIVTAGAKFALYLAFQVLLDPGDEVIIPAPYWVSYMEQVRLAEGAPIVVHTTEADGFRLTPAALLRSLTPKTRAIVLNSPCNPTGAVYDRESLAAIAAVAEARDLVLISDEIYEPFVYGGRRHVSVASLGDTIRARTLLVHGLSKSHAMTGWRVGYAVGPRALIDAMIGLQSHSISNATSIAQKAAVAALTGPQEPVERMVREFAARREYVVRRLQELPGVTCTVPEGAFYAFPRVDAVFGQRWRGDRSVTDSTALAEQLLEEAHVALVPGQAFGAEGYLRLSYAASRPQLEKGLDRMAAFWERLS